MTRMYKPITKQPFVSRRHDLRNFVVGGIKESALTLPKTVDFVMGNMLTSCCNSICWILVLVFIAWPLAFLLSMVWVFLQVRQIVISSLCSPQKVIDLTAFDAPQPFESFLPCVRSISNTLERYVTWPRECGRAIMSGTHTCPTP